MLVSCLIADRRQETISLLATYLLLKLPLTESLLAEASRHC